MRAGGLASEGPASWEHWLTPWCACLSKPQKDCGAFEDLYLLLDLRALLKLVSKICLQPECKDDSHNPTSPTPIPKTRTQKPLDPKTTNTPQTPKRFKKSLKPSQFGAQKTPEPQAVGHGPPSCAKGVADDLEVQSSNARWSFHLLLGKRVDALGY